MISRRSRRQLARPVAKPMVLEICADEMSVTQTAVYLLIAERTLRNWRTRGYGPAGSHLRYRMVDNEKWIAENKTGPGGRHERFPVARVAPDQVAKFLIASGSARFKGRTVSDGTTMLEDMRRDGYGPPWLKLARVISYWIPEVVDWAEQRGIESRYVMRPMVGAVVVKPPFVHAPEILALTEALHHSPTSSHLTNSYEEQSQSK